MGSLENNIRLIRNETVEGGNTKERIAETFELLATELERKVNKDANKGLSSNDFSNEHKNKLEGLQQVDTSGLLQKGAYTGNASSLKADIDKKVDKVAGKGLSSNDYTNEEKRKNEENALKRVANITVTGDVNKIITITFADSTVMQAPFKDNDHIPLADVHMNSLNFNENTGVLTGVKSDGNEISVSLDGRYSLIGHNHDDRYAPITHHHNEYALRTHRHNWDDIDGKPNNLATTESVKAAVDSIEIGGRNYFLNSKFFKAASFYVASGITVINKDNEGLSEIHSTSGNGNWVRIYDNPTNIDYFVDKYVTVSFDIKVLEGDLTSPTFYGGSFMNYQEMKPVSKKHEIGKWNRVYTTFLVVRDEFSIHLGFQYAIGKYQFKNFKFEIGNKPTDWTPAPEDIKEYDPVGNIINGTRQILPNEADKVIFVTNSVDNCALNVFPDKCSVSFRKVFDGGHVNFSCLGRNIIYTGDNQFNGKKGSTAVVSIYGNDCYIDIRNV